MSAEFEGSIYSKRILLTGGAGFIGGHVVSNLVERYPDYYVVNYDKLEYCSCLKNLEKIATKPNYKFVNGDICDEDKLREVLHQERIDTVLHFAAQSHVDNSFRSADNFTRSNVQGTSTLLETAKQYGGITLFLHVSTDEVYGGNSKVALTEEAPLNPMNPYSKSKAEAEIIAKSYWDKYRFPVIITRGNNVYGPHQFPEKVVPKFIGLLLKGKKCCIHGDGTCTRNFMYVQDAVEAYLTVLHKGEVGEIYNIGTEFRISVNGVANILTQKILGHKKDEDEHEGHMEFVQDRPHNDKDYPIDSSKLRSLDWCPKMPWDKGLDITIEWYRHNFSNWGELSERALVPFPDVLGETTKENGEDQPEL
ncbi:dTDP-D-glucose 4,6-dehydratase-like [Patiria miniata]|uniref:dTDP-D-glucose 4,6-dehydratase n=1 Tax=Patiria miniata TaxID=46514 RepID=A0A913ZF80_PATMI|nr:dTDP-D-glucose 4,6-dehydratase-like [Patiria miniata]